MQPSDNTPSLVSPVARQGVPEAVATRPFFRRLLELAGSRPEPTPLKRPPKLTDGLLGSLRPSSKMPLTEINPPPLPQVFLALRRTAEDPMSSMADVAEIVSTDPSLATYVLRLANSPLYARGQEVETVARAVRCIGMAEIQTMALGAALGRVFRNPPRPELLSLPHFWRHAVSVGLLSGTMAERQGVASRDRAFVAGLVHDMGRLLLAIAEPDLAALALHSIGDDPSSLDAAERAALGFDHAVLGGRVCGKWELPDSLGEAVAWHHDPALCPDNALTGVVHVADFTANLLGFRAQPTGGLPVLDLGALDGLHLGEAEAAPLLAALDFGLDGLAALFST